MKPYLFALFLLFGLSSCSKKSETELWKEGHAAVESGKFQIAIEQYQEIISRFHDSPYADSALYRIAVIYNNDLHDYAMAAQYYIKYNSTFPNSKEAPTALFLSAFIYNNELHKLDSAKILYERFLQQYPAHSLANSAKFEMETLGKDPGEFIKKDMMREDSSGFTSKKAAK